MSNEDRMIAETNLNFWKERLNVRKDVAFKRVPRSRWDGNNGRHLWGITADGDFLYSKSPSEETIVHELLHLKYPCLSEAEVRSLTKAFLY